MPSSHPALLTKTLRSKSIAAMLAIALVATACGGSESERALEPDDSSDSVATQVDQGTNDDAGAGQADAPDGGGSDAPSDEAQTLEGYLGLAAGLVRGGGQGAGGPGGGLDTEALDEQRQLIEQEVQLCMQAQGFTYVPEASTDDRFFRANERQGISDADFAASEGFGISTRFDAIFDGEVELDDTVDPNDEYLDTLSDGERDAW